MRVESGTSNSSSSETALQTTMARQHASVVLDRVTRMAHQLLRETGEETLLLRRAISTDRRLTGTFMASPQSRANMIQETTDPNALGTSFSPALEERIRLHQELRSAATLAMFREIGAFRGTGLACVVLPALIQVGRGSVQTPAAHTCPVPTVVLTLPRSDSKTGESPLIILKRLTLAQLVALIKASKGREQVEAWGLPSGTMTERNWEELEDWLREGILLQGVTARLGAMTIEVPKVANEFDSELERTERAVIQEALNCITMEGESWRDRASHMSAQLQAAADAALQRALKVLECGERIRTLIESGSEDAAAWDVVIEDLRQQGKSAVWQDLLQATLELKDRLQSPSRRRSVQSAATALALHHQRKSEISAQALQAFKSPHTVQMVLGGQKTPSPGTVAGELGEAYASVRLRRRSRSSAEGRASPAMALSFDHEEDPSLDPPDGPPLKRPCQPAQMVHMMRGSCRLMPN